MGTTSGYATNFIREMTQPRDRVVIGPSLAVYFIAKRCFDFVASLIMLIFLAPFLLIIAILVKLDSPGPAIYSQQRVGCKIRFINGVLQKQLYTFTFYKFRSMKYRADESSHRAFIEAYIRNDIEGMKKLQKGPTTAENTYKLNGDDRITRVGSILRKTSLDELPQLWNILKGDMSLVGPRPAIPYEVELYEPRHLKRLYTVPGLTGLWQAVARNSVSFDDMVRLDIEYIDRQCFSLDLKILVETPKAVFDKKCG